MKQEETIISEKIEKFLNSRRIYNRRNQANTTSYGRPDREALYKGILIGLEVKTDKGSPQGNQTRILETYTENGGFGATVRSVEDVKFIIDFIDKHYDYAENKRFISDLNKNFVENVSKD